MPIDSRIPLLVRPIDIAADQSAREHDRLQTTTMQQQIEMNNLKLQEAKKQAGMGAADPEAEQKFMQQVVEEAGGDPHQIPAVLLRYGRVQEALEFVKGWPTEKQTAPKVVQVQTVDEQGNPVTKFVEEQAGQSFPMVQKPPTGESLPASAKEYEYAKAQGYKGTFEDYQNADANRRRPVVNVGSGAEPLVPIMGPDGRPVLVRRSQAEGKQPASSREQGRAVTSGDANRITDLDASLSDLATLKQTVSKSGSTGIAPSVGAAMPNFVTNATGFGVSAKERQAVIDRVKQVIGKALEGGVLRKEDEMKYAKILPTISDNPQVVATKLAGLQQAIAQRKSTLLDNLSDAGYDTSRFEARTAPAPSSGGVKVGPYTVREKK